MSAFRIPLLRQVVISLFILLFALFPYGFYGLADLLPSYAHAAPSTDYIVPFDIEMNEDNGASFDLKDLLGAAYTDGGLLPDYLSSDIGYCEATDNTAENECTVAETFTIPADTTAIRITAYGTNSDATNDDDDDDFILINTTVDLDPKSTTYETYSGSLSFPFFTTSHRAYAWAGVALGAASNSDSPVGANTAGDSLTVDVSGSTLSITQTQTLVNTAYLVEYLSSVDNSTLLRGIESIVLDGGAASGTGVTIDSVDIPDGTDYIVITESGGRPSGSFRVESKILSRMIMEFQPSRDDYSKVTGLVANLRGRGPAQTVTYGFEDLDVFGPTTGGVLAVGSEATTTGDIVANANVSHSPDVYVSGGKLFIERTFDVADSAGSNFISQYAVEFYERAEQASAAMFLGSSIDTIDLNSPEDSRDTCDPVAAPENCLDLDIPSGASLGLINIVAFNRTGGSADNENWGTMSAIVEIDKEVSPGVYEDKSSGNWVNTRASTPDTVSWSDLDLGTRLFNEDTDLPESGVVSNKADFNALTDGFPGSTNLTRINVDGQDTLRIDLEQKNVSGANSYGANLFIASIQWFGPEPIIFSNVPDEFGFTPPALNLGGGEWQLGANAIINNTIEIDPPAGYNNDGSASYGLGVARATDPTNTATINVVVNPVTDIMELDDVDPNDMNPAGNTVAEILGTSNTSPTANDSGIAVTGFSVDTGVGTWQYSLDGGGTWNNLGGVSPFNALLLGPTDMLRVLPAGENMTGEVDFVSWDMSNYSAGDFQNPTVGPADDFTLFGLTSDTATIMTLSAPGATEASLLVWYKADDGPNTVTNGGAISRWVDTGAGGNDGFGNTGAQPTYVEYSKDNNFQPSADFTFAGMETLTADLLGDSNPYTKVAVVKQNSNAGQQTIIGGGSGATHGMYLTSGAAALTLDHDGNTITGGSVTAGETALVVIRNGTTTPDNVIRVDGVGVVDNTIHSYVDGATLAVGAQDGTNSFNGFIPESIVYDAEVADINLQRIESYLGIKYGLTLPNDYLDSTGSTTVYAASTSAYNQGIVGLARDDATALRQNVAHSQETDSVLYLSTDSDFTSANNDPLRTVLPNGTYLVAGHDGAATTFTGTYNGVSGDALARTWQFSETLDAGTVHLAVPSTIIFPAGIPVVVQSTDTTFDGADTGAQLVDDGSFFSAALDIADDSYVTFAVEQKPEVVDITRSNPTTATTSDTLVSFEVTFNEDVSDVTTDDFVVDLTGSVTGTVQSITEVDAQTYLVTVNNVTGNGFLGIAIDPGHDINDNFGLLLDSNLPSGADEEYEVDTTAPSGPTVITPSAGDSVNSPTEVTGVCSGAENGTVSVTTAPGGGIIPDPTISSIDASGNFAVDVFWSGVANGNTYDLLVTCIDAAGNTSVTTTVSGISPDLVAPQVQLEQSGVQSDPTYLQAAQFIVTFSEEVDGSTVEVTDFDLSASTAAGVAVSSVSEISPFDGTTYKLTITSTGDGDIQVSLPAGTVQDLAGNLNAGSLSIDNVVTVDTNPPAAPTVNEPVSGATVNSPTNVEIVCNEPDEIITISNSNIIPNPTTYTCTAAGPQDVSVDWADGTSGSTTLSVTLTDPAGNVSPMTDVAVSVDLDDPGVAVEQKVDQTDPTNVNSLTWTITFSEPINETTFDVSDLVLSAFPSGSIAGLTVNGPTEVAPNDDTTYEVEVTGVTDGDAVTLSIPVGVVEDLSGNLNTTSVSTDNQISYDGTAPSAITVDSPTTGSAIGNPTEVFGACEPGSTVVIANSDIQGSPIEVVCDASGMYSVDILWESGTSGSTTIDVYEEDAAGNQSSTISVPVTVDLDPPTTPTITFPSNGGTTDGTVEGVGTPGDTIDVLISPGGQVCQTTVQPDGTWSCDVAPPLVSPGDEGPLFITATATDNAGNMSGPDTVFATGDVTSPSDPTISDPDGSTNVSNPTTVSGTCESNGTVTISNPNIIPDPTEVACTASGTYTTDVLWDAAADGATSTLDVSVTDEAGNTSGTTSVDVFVDLTGPAAPTGISPSTATNNTSLPITGVCEPGSLVTIYGPGIIPDPKTESCTASSTFAAYVQFTDVGTTTVSVIQTDEAGNSSPATSHDVVVSPRISSGGGSSVRFVCKDPAAINYKTYGRHKQSRCEYPEDSSLESVENTETIIPTLTQSTLSVCEPYLTETIALGRSNNPVEVNKLITFLNNHEGEALALDGTYDQDDFEAVKRFQSKYSSSVLEVWGLTQPTGYVYLTTRMKINSFNCNKSLECPVFREFNGRTQNTNSVEVQRTKVFMTELGFYNGPINTIWDDEIYRSMIDFQETFSATMLKPWGLTKGTGYKYKTTNKFMNEMVGCPIGEILLENGVSVSY